MRLCREFALALLVPASFAQGPAPLPPNYKPILDNEYVLVQRVHYGPHELIPMHDHPAVATVYVYLNNSGVVDIAHEGPDAETVHRPPTHTGAFRISPGAFERHSVQNQSDLPSDFLRIELKHVPVGYLPSEFRGPAPTEPYHSSSETLYENPALRIERTICVIDEKCTAGSINAPSLLVVIPLKRKGEPRQNPVFWFPSNTILPATEPFEGTSDPSEILRIILPKH